MLLIAASFKSLQFILSDIGSDLVTGLVPYPKVYYKKVRFGGTNRLKLVP